MATVFTDIEKCFQKKLDSISGKPKVSWENDAEYKPVLGTRYWRPTNIPTRGELVTTGMLQKHMGLYQVDVFVPTQKGVGQLMSDLDAIYTAFNTVNSLTEGTTRVDILNIGRGRVERDASWCRGFIEIYYMCYSH